MGREMEKIFSFPLFYAHAFVHLKGGYRKRGEREVLSKNASLYCTAREEGKAKGIGGTKGHSRCERKKLTCVHYILYVVPDLPHKCKEIHQKTGSIIQ